jgi:cysteine synthase A
LTQACGPGVRNGFSGAVGGTPLLRLRAMSEETGCEILGKAEFMNPGGSVKDRAALAIVSAAEKRGELAAGGTVVEGTAGNTGIGLAHVCNERGYRCVIVMPDNQSPAKYELLAMLGAEVHRVPVVPYSNPNQYQKVASRLAASLPGAIWSNQFDNLANREIHLATTGPEIWEQSGGRVDAFVAASGTGGTFSGVSEYLHSQRHEIRCVLADPPGSSLYEYVRHGALKATGAGSITEGIGIARITANLALARIDDAVHVEDAETVRFVYRLLNEEGLFLGSTSGINVAAAVRVARELGPGHTIVTVLCDGGANYQARLFNRDWLKEKGLAASAPAPQRAPVALGNVLVG